MDVVIVTAAVVISAVAYVGCTGVFQSKRKVSQHHHGNGNFIQSLWSRWNDILVCQLAVFVSCKYDRGFLMSSSHSVIKLHDWDIVCFLEGSCLAIHNVDDCLRYTSDVA